MSHTSTLNISVLQLCSTDHPSENQKNILKLLEKVPSETQVVFLPENSLYMKLGEKSPTYHFQNTDSIYEPFREWSSQRQCHLLFGANPVSANGGGVKNATVWVKPSGQVEDVYSKIHLFDVDVEGHKPVRESDQFIHGSTPKVIDICGWKLGLSICYDLRFSELYQIYAKQEVDIIAVPAAFLVPTGSAHWHVLLRARAIESQAFVVAAAQAGTHLGTHEQKRETYGHSLVVDPWGRVLIDMETKNWQVANLTLDCSALRQVRAQIPMSRHRRL
ncbi:MAG: carbon-nitrogen hydrolase family protein [Bdellovibrionales bacterium]|nr:carbon-nitrogen hydrolase family protein [Bdellovibrionales bacterium]